MRRPTHSEPPPQGAIALLPCNGNSVRGRLATEVSQLLRRQMGDDLSIVMPVPLAAGIPVATNAFHNARYVLGVAGCEQRCDVKVCSMAVGVPPDDTVLLGDLVRPELAAYEDLGENEREELLLQLSSRVLAKISEID